MTGGRPLRFLAGVVGGWTGLRLWALWPAALAVLPVAHRSGPTGLVALPLFRPDQVPALPPLLRPATDPPATAPPAAPRAARAPDPGRIALALAALTRYGAAEPIGQDGAFVAERALVRPLPPAPPAAGRRWSGSAWLLLRGGGGGAGQALAGGQLGGAQGGARLSYLLDPARRVSLTARVSSPLHGPGREAAAGIAWRPTRAPVTLVAEERVGLERGVRGGPALGVIAGLNPTPVLAGFRLEAYGQAGAIGRDGVVGFADGAARLARAVTHGPVRLDLGLGAWGGAQPGVARLDVGPSASMSVPAAGHRLRLTLDWRVRVAGDARPDTGPALSLGSDF